MADFTEEFVLDFDPFFSAPDTRRHDSVSGPGQYFLDLHRDDHSPKAISGGNLEYPNDSSLFVSPISLARGWKRNFRHFYATFCPSDFGYKMDPQWPRIYTNPSLFSFSALGMVPTATIDLSLDDLGKTIGIDCSTRFLFHPAKNFGCRVFCPVSVVHALAFLGRNGPNLLIFFFFILAQIPRTFILSPGEVN